MYKRYEYRSHEGIKWTNWFHTFFDKNKDPWQLKNRLRNEYKEDSDQNLK